MIAGLLKNVLNFTLIFRKLAVIATFFKSFFLASQNKSNQSNEFIQHGFDMGEKVSKIKCKSENRD